MKPKVLVITGPTASGKSSFAIEKTLKLNGEIINADSRQIYKDLIVGTASPSKEDKIKIPHHLYNFLDPSERYSAPQFVEDVTKVINEVLAKGKLPILVGGTGLYLETLIFGYENPPGDPEIKENLEKLETEELFKLLQEKDPKYADSINNNSRYYIIRALEIIEATGETRTENMKKRKEVPFTFEVIYKTFPREELWERIKDRLETYMWDDWVKEVKLLMAKYKDWSLPGFTSHGYKEVKAFIENKLTRQEAKEKIYIMTRQYAKRQETWFKRKIWQEIMNVDLVNITK